jgi:hypothetical protein
VLVGSGYDIVGGTSSSWPNEEADVMIDEILRPSSNAVLVHAYEEEPTSAYWWVEATAICATAT